MNNQNPELFKQNEFTPTHTPTRWKHPVNSVFDPSKTIKKATFNYLKALKELNITEISISNLENK